jgi:hypothetical protein
VNPLFPSTITSAPSAIDDGAALWASAISEFWSAIKYSSTGAMAGYAAFFACAGAWRVPPGGQRGTRRTNAMSLKPFFRIGISDRRILLDSHWKEAGIRFGGR